MWRYSEGNRKRVVVFVLLFVVAQIVYLAEPAIIARIFTAVQSGTSGAELFHIITTSFSLILVVIAIFWMLHGTARIMEQENAFMARKRYREEMLRKTLDLPVSWHAAHHSGDTIDKINKGATSVFDFSSEIYLMVQMVVRLTGSLAILAYFDWLTALVAGSVSVLAFLLLTKFDVQLKKTYDGVFKWENRLAATVHDYVSNVFTVITLRLKLVVLKRIEEQSWKGLPLFIKNAKLNEVKWATTDFLVMGMVAGVLVLYSYRSYVTSGSIAIGILYALYQYLQNVGNTFYNFAWQYGQLLKKDAAVRNANILEQEYAKMNIPLPVYLPADWKTLQIKDLMFAYPSGKNDQKEGKKSHVDGISLTLDRGKKIALIGESGSGKSTVLALLRGLYLSDTVTVFCDGRKLHKGLAHLYEHATLIPQDPEIFNATAKENIVMGTSGLEERVKKALHISRFSSVVSRLPHGLTTNVMEKGVSLSGGEKQRLALARGILAARDSDILLLDEPTSSVDSVNEREIYEGIFQEFEGKTIISTIHRLHLLRSFDYIYFFQEGNIRAEGNFHTLLEEPLFRVLWENYIRETEKQKKTSE
jgi:ABC-type multidrug transport system fused ATPase/permease subunit